MTGRGGYASPKAFRRALTDRLKTVAAGSRWELPQLQRQIAYDRLLERLYLTDRRWILKGATALLARDLGVRGTIDMPDVSQHGYRAYPLVDHVADKVVAIFDRYGSTAAPSTRYKDLVDLVAIATGASVEAAAQMRALTSEAGRRGVVLPSSFDVPDREPWERGYAAEAGRSLLDIAQSLDEALAIIGPFLDPLLDGSARGHWDPEDGAWV